MNTFVKSNQNRNMKLKLLCMAQFPPMQPSFARLSPPLKAPLHHFRVPFILDASLPKFIILNILGLCRMDVYGKVNVDFDKT